MFAATKSFFAKAPAGGALTPSWSIDWSTGTPSGYTLTRASSGTYVDSSGYIASQASGTSGNSAARLTHNSSGTRLGLLVEEQRTNIAQLSEDFANAYWTKRASTINNNGGSFWTSPANASDAVLLEQTSTTSEHHVRRSLTTANPCWSVFVKKQNLTTGTGRAGRYVTLLMYESAATTEYVHATFDLDAGTMTQSATAGTNFTNLSHGIEAFPNDWYRIH